jgi:hypothetical protein
VAFEDAEEAVVHPCSPHADLVEPRHLTVHGLPLTATRECRRRRLGDSVKDCEDLGDHLVRQPVEEVPRRYGLAPIVVGVALEEVQVPRFTPPAVRGRQASSPYVELMICSAASLASEGATWE